tara:strand:+ start:729 stop:935 length:207 start_codon:yes stop_codon:yes gene_type:complete
MRNQSLLESLSLLLGQKGWVNAAEHGLGRAKIGLADALRDPVERIMMLRIKKSFDDTNQLNPGVLISS